MRGQGGLQTSRVTFQHSRHLQEAEAKRTQSHDLGSSSHLVGSIDPISGRRALRSQQASSLVQSQRFNRDTEPPGCFGRTQKRSGRTHKSPLRLLIANLMKVAPGARSTGYSYLLS